MKIARTPINHANRSVERHPHGALLVSGNVYHDENRQQAHDCQCQIYPQIMPKLGDTQAR